MQTPPRLKPTVREQHLSAAVNSAVAQTASASVNRAIMLNTMEQAPKTAPAEPIRIDIDKNIKDDLQ